MSLHKCVYDCTYDIRATRRQVLPLCLSLLPPLPSAHTNESQRETEKKREGEGDVADDPAHTNKETDERRAMVVWSVILYNPMPVGHGRNKYSVHFPCVQIHTHTHSHRHYTKWLRRLPNGYVCKYWMRYTHVWNFNLYTNYWLRIFVDSAFFFRLVLFCIFYFIANLVVMHINVIANDRETRFFFVRNSVTRL